MSHTTPRRLRMVRPAIPIVLACLLTWSAPLPAQVIDRILAVVGRQIITLSDVRAALAFGFVRVEGDDPVGDTVRQLIDRELILAEADRYLPPEPDPGAVEREFERVRARFESEAELGRAGREHGLSDVRLREIVMQNVRIQVYLEQRFAAAARPTDEEIARYFSEYGHEFETDGVRPSLADVRDRIAARLADERRRALIDDWLDGLRRRVDVVNLHAAGR